MNLSLKKVVFSWFTFWLALAGLAIYFLMPLRERLRFGIDLVGGTYITLEVQTDKAVEAGLLDKQENFLADLKAANAVAPTKYDTKDNTIELEFSSVNDAQAAIGVLKQKEPSLVYSSDGTFVRARFSKTKEDRIKEDAVERNINVLRSRLDKMSVAEITIAKQGERNIIVELPDVDDPQQAKQMIGTAAILEFKLVEKVGNSSDDILYEYDGELPAGMEILPGKGQDKLYYLVPKRAAVTGKYLTDAFPNFIEQKAQWVVNFEFNRDGGEKFYDLTSKNYRRQVAAILDGVVITAPSINTAIRNEGYIEGRDFTADSAKELALLLKSGSFVAPVTFEEERQVGPSLGHESIRKGITSCLVGLGLLLIFSLFYYSVSGLLAFIALLFNLVLILFGVSTLHATLTLPGIAGMVLTVGMAIDASILIYERIKEELATGNTTRKAVSEGFSNAMRVILDANITTFIVGAVLYKFGTGPIQGFAVTMMLGIISTLITGLFFLRSLFTFVLDVFNVQKLKI